MSYYIKRDEIYNVQKLILIATNTWLEQLESLRNALNVMASANMIEGAAADNIRSYVQEEPIAIIEAMSACIQFYQAKFLVCSNGYSRIDQNESAQINAARLDSICEILKRRNTVFYDTREAVVRKLNSVSDIFSGRKPSNSVFYDYKELGKKVSSLKQDIADYENIHTHDMDDINNLLSKLTVSLHEALSRTSVQMTSYASGVIPSGNSMRATAEALLVCAAHTSDEKFQENLKAAVNSYKDQLEAELAEERKKKGIQTVIGGVGAVLAGAACIIATWGAATPVVVAGFAVGGTAIGFGVAESLEGAQDIYYGSIGDLDSVAFNPLRDTVFASNPELYYTVGKISTTASIVFSAGMGIANVGTGLIAEGATTGQAVGGMAIEGAKMAGSSLAGAGAGKLAYEWTGDEVFANVVGTGVGIGTYGLASKFIDTNSIVGLNGTEGNVEIGKISHEFDEYFTDKSVAVKTEQSNNVNQWFKEELGYDPPYQPNTKVRIYELTHDSTNEYCRVYDKTNSRMQGGWVLRKEDIAGLTPEQIQEMYALPYKPKYICDVSYPSGTIIREGQANSLFNFNGGGVQFDTIGLNQGFVGEFLNERMISID